MENGFHPPLPLQYLSLGIQLTARFFGSARCLD